MDAAYGVHYSALNSWSDVATRSLFVFFNGGAAVSIFFVLSGYVLGLSLNKKALSEDRNSFLDSLGFVVRRLFRLFPAHIVSLSVVIASLYLFHEPARFTVASPWFSGFYGSSLSLSNVLDNYLLLSTNLNPVTWTLQVELIMSLLFPVAFLVCRGLSIGGNLIALAVVAYFCYRLQNFFLIYSFVFYAGLVLSQLRPSALISMSSRVASLLFFLGLGILLSARMVVSATEMFDIAATECLGAVLIVFVLSNRLEGARLGACLDHRWVRELGKISYSFYVLHFIVLYWLAYLGLREVSPAWVNEYRFVFGLALAGISIPIAVVIAQFSYRWVEQPFIGVGARASKGLVSSLSLRSSALRHRLTAVSESTLLRRYPGLCYVFAMLPVLYFAQVTMLFGRSAVYAPMDLAKHTFSFSDFANFHVLALALPLTVAMACFHYLNRRPSTTDLLRFIFGYAVLGVALTSVHFFMQLGTKAIQLYQWQDLDNFALAWLSSYGSVYYVCWSIMLSLVWVHIAVRLPRVVQCLTLALMVPAVMFLPRYAASSSMPFLFAPWSPLNALPVASCVGILFSASWVRDNAHKVILSSLVLAVCSGVYEWNVMLSEAYGASQLAALPVSARLSLYTSVFAVLAFVVSRHETGELSRILAKCSIPALLLYPLLSYHLIGRAASLAFDQASFGYWSFTLVTFFLLLAGGILWRFLALLNVPVLQPSR